MKDVAYRKSVLEAVVQLRAKGKSANEACREIKASASSHSRWRKARDANGDAGLEPQTGRCGRKSKAALAVILNQQAQTKQISDKEAYSAMIAELESAIEKLSKMPEISKHTIKQNRAALAQIQAPENAAYAGEAARKFLARELTAGTVGPWLASMLATKGKPAPARREDIIAQLEQRIRSMNFQFGKWRKLKLSVRQEVCQKLAAWVVGWPKDVRAALVKSLAKL